MLILITLPLELYLLYGESQDAYHLINNWRTSWACLSKIIEESCTIHHQYFMIIYLTLLTSTTVFVKYLFTFVQGKKKKEWFFGFSWSVTILETLLVKTISLRFVRVSLPSENVTKKNRFKKSLPQKWKRDLLMVAKVGSRKLESQGVGYQYILVKWMCYCLILINIGQERNLSVSCSILANYSCILSRNSGIRILIRTFHQPEDFVRADESPFLLFLFLFSFWKFFFFRICFFLLLRFLVPYAIWLF